MVEIVECVYVLNVSLLWLAFEADFAFDHFAAVHFELGLGHKQVPVLAENGSNCDGFIGHSECVPCDDQPC